jgi:hypothetical protein
VPALLLLVIPRRALGLKNVELSLGGFKDLVDEPQLPAIFRDLHGDDLSDLPMKLGLNPVPMKRGRHPKAKSKQPFPFSQIHNLHRLDPRMKRVTGQAIAKALPTPVP